MNRKYHSKQFKILDFGCGTGKLIAGCIPFVHFGGRIIGIDIGQKEINFCKTFYPKNICSFYKISAHNAYYNVNGKPASETEWPIPDESVDLIISISVFTHLNEEDAHFYMNLINRKLVSGGITIITFFLLDDNYNPKDLAGTRWIFDKYYFNNKEWRFSSKIDIPEAQIGVTNAGLESLLKNTELKIEKSTK